MPKMNPNKEYAINANKNANKIFTKNSAISELFVTFFTVGITNKST